MVVDLDGKEVLLAEAEEFGRDLPGGGGVLPAVADGLSVEEDAGPVGDGAGGEHDALALPRLGDEDALAIPREAVVGLVEAPGVGDAVGGVGGAVRVVGLTALAFPFLRREDPHPSIGGRVGVPAGLQADVVRIGAELPETGEVDVGG